MGRIGRRRKGLVTYGFIMTTAPHHQANTHIANQYATNTAKIGITEYAAKSLGDVVFVELPTADTEVGAGEPVGAVESVKSASDVLSPVSGTIVQGNALLDDEPKAINGDPEGAAWIAEIKVSDASKLDELWDKQAYKKSIEDAE